jgi:hypothetical protein
MSCPGCAAEMVHDHDDRMYCIACGLAGPRDALEKLAARFALAKEMYDLIGRASQRAKPSRQASSWMDDAVTLRARWQFEVLREGWRHE